MSTENFIKMIREQSDIDAEHLEKLIVDIMGDKTSNDYVIKLLNFRLSEVFNYFDSFNKIDVKCKSIEISMKSIILSSCMGNEDIFKESKTNFELHVKEYRKMIELFEKEMYKNIKEKSDKTPH